MAVSNVPNTIDWEDSGIIKIIDQTQLPHKLVIIELKNYKEVENAITTMLIRGAPAIGVAGAFGLAIGAIELSYDESSIPAFLSKLQDVADFLIKARPTAVNLAWAVNLLMENARNSSHTSVGQLTQYIIQQAKILHNNDIKSCLSIGEYGATVIPKGARILTHCNAGSLATVAYGTALGVIRTAYNNDPSIKVFANETRPRQQGARLTTWELCEDNIPTTLLTDGMCAHFMSKKLIDVVVVGADRIAANGDSANKIGTFSIAIIAKEFGIPFYIAAPLSTIDQTISEGSLITIEERSAEEVTTINNERICHKNVNISNPSFDVTPAKYISGIITDKGILKPDFKKSIASSLI